MYLKNVSLIDLKNFQVMLKTLQNNERTRCEEKMKLIYNLNKFLNEGGRDAKLPSRKSRKESLPKIKGNDTFLFLKVNLILLVMKWHKEVSL